MKSADGVKLPLTATIRDALKILDSGAMHIALVVEQNNRLIATLSDGDVRRALLNNFSLDDGIEGIVSRTPLVALLSHSDEEILQKALDKRIYQIPIVDDFGCVIGIKEIEEFVRPKIKPNKVVLMVGGLGSRLRPLTENIPKPMLRVGDKPILQTIVERFASIGFINIVMCVNYKSQVICDYFGNGSRFGVHIEYVFEERRMGTAGALSLVKSELNHPFFVMNGDILTNVNFEHLLAYHIESNAMATMCVREYEFQVPYGVVNLEGHRILSIEEKPLHKFFVSAGIYMLSPDVLSMIPRHEYYDMPTLFEAMIRNAKKTISFPIREYWLDIGRIEEYEKANIEYHEVF